MITFEEAYSRAMKEVSYGFHIKNVELDNFDDPYEKVEGEHALLVTNGKELICRTEKGDRIGFFRIVNLSQMLKNHNSEIRNMLIAGLLWYDTDFFASLVEAH